jgi:hypothetical protein
VTLMDPVGEPVGNPVRPSRHLVGHHQRRLGRIRVT